MTACVPNLEGYYHFNYYDISGKLNITRSAVKTLTDHAYCTHLSTSLLQDAGPQVHTKSSQEQLSAIPVNL